MSVNIVVARNGNHVSYELCGLALLHDGLFYCVLCCVFKSAQAYTARWIKLVSHKNTGFGQGASVNKSRCATRSADGNFMLNAQCWHV